MTAIFIVVSIILFIACLHQANIMTNRTPFRYQAALVLVMVSVISLVIVVLKHPTPPHVLLAVIALMVAVAFWLAIERRATR